MPFTAKAPLVSHALRVDGVTPAMVLKRSRSSFVYEDELRDLLTYTCPVTGVARCPPCFKANMPLNQGCSIFFYRG